MAKNQRSYTPEFKQQIVDLYNAGGTSYPQLEREYGVSRSTLINWIKQFSPIRVSEEETVTLKEYKALVRVPSNKHKEYEEFDRKVKQVYDDSKQRYGAVKICHALNDNGAPCCIKRVQRHMAEQGLHSVVVKKYHHHANHGSIPDDKVNILKRNLGTETINQKWCTDITYIHVKEEGCVESFHSVLKKEEIYLHTYQDSTEARRAIFELQRVTFKTIANRKRWALIMDSYSLSYTLDPEQGMILSCLARRYRNINGWGS